MGGSVDVTGSMEGSGSISGGTTSGKEQHKQINSRNVLLNLFYQREVVLEQQPLTELQVVPDRQAVKVLQPEVEDYPDPVL